VKRVAADQSIIDQAIALQAQGKTDAEIARELGVGPATPSNWRKQGRLPEKPQRKTNGGKVREYEPLPKLQPGQRLDGTPEPKKEEKPRMIEVEKAKVEEKAAELASPRISRSIQLEGEYVRLNIDNANMIRIAMEYNWSQPMTAKEVAMVLMDLELDARALIAEVEKWL
jgi:predicted transcriptional regulator